MLCNRTSIACKAAKGTACDFRLSLSMKQSFSRKSFLQSVCCMSGRGGFRGARGGRGGRGGSFGRGGGGSAGRVVSVVQPSSGTLSERFAQIRQQAAASGAVARTARVAVNQQRSSAVRQNTFALNRRGRGGPIAVVVTPRDGGSPRGGRGRGAATRGGAPGKRGGAAAVRVGGKLAQNVQRGGRGGARGAGRARGRARAAPRPAAVRTPEDLDMELATYQGIVS